MSIDGERSVDAPPGDGVRLRPHDALGQIGGESDLYTSVLSRLLAGPLAFGGIGWGLDRWLSTKFFLPVGIVLGMALAIYVVWLRYGSHDATSAPAPMSSPGGDAAFSQRPARSTRIEEKK